MEILFTAKLMKVAMVVSTLYTKLPHDDLKSELSSIDNFALRGVTKLLLDCLDWCSILGEENKRRFGFSKTSLKNSYKLFNRKLQSASQWRLILHHFV